MYGGGFQNDKLSSLAWRKRRWYNIWFTVDDDWTNALMIEFNCQRDTLIMV